MSLHTLPELLGILLRDVGEVSYLPSEGNAGDALISASTFAVLGTMGIRITPGAMTVLVAGGGNLVPSYNCLERRLAGVPREGRRVIILPSTVIGCFGLLRQFKDLALLAREEMTLVTARMERVRVWGCEDAAFSYDYSRFSDPGDGVLRAFRTDVETAGRALPTGNLDVSVVTVEGQYWTPRNAGPIADQFVRTISQSAEVETDRCHVAIAAAKLGKRVRFYPGSYHKNRSIYLSSLVGFPNVEWVDFH